MTKTKNQQKITYLGGGVCILTTGLSILLLLIDPAGLDYSKLVNPVVALLFVGALGFSYSAPIKSSNKVLATAGIIALASFFTLAGLLIIVVASCIIAIVRF